MKIVVIGGRGLIGAKVAAKLGAQGHDVTAASRRSGVDALTGKASPPRSRARMSWSTCPVHRCSTTTR